MKKNLLLTIALLIPAVITGCMLITGTTVLVFHVAGFQSSTDTMRSVSVDLSTNSDYQDNKDKIKSVDAVSVAGIVGNLSATPVAAEVWLADINANYSTPAEVRAHATRIFLSPTIPAHDTLVLNWSDGMSHVENFNVLADHVKNGGSFKLYGISTGSFDISFLVDLIITITVGK
jgi:hypothetical protein